MMTNTVVTTHTFHHLPDIVRRLVSLRRLARMEFWAYWPMQAVDDKDLIARHADVLPYLREAVLLALQHGPRRLRQELPRNVSWQTSPGVLDNTQLRRSSSTPHSGPSFRKNGFEQCVHRASCASRRCLGLNTAYIQKYGWQPDLLKPLPTRTGWEHRRMTSGPPNSRAGSAGQLLLDLVNALGIPYGYEAIAAALPGIDPSQSVPGQSCQAGDQARSKP